MALQEQRGPQRDGTAQAERRRAELAPGAVGIDERTPAELIGLARRVASQLYWYGPDNHPGGWWAAPERDADVQAGSPVDPARTGPSFFDGIGPNQGDAGGLSYAEAAAFAADPAAFPGDRFATLRRPHMALFLTAVRLMRHGQRALNALTERHLDHHLREVLRLAPRPAQPDRAYVLFELAVGVRAAEAPDGLRLLAGRDSRHRDRVYRLERGLIVNQARVARLSSTFVDREVVGLAEARRAIVGTPDEQFLFLIAIALGDPRPGDPLPAFRGAALTMPRLAALGQLIGFAGRTMFLELFELRAMLERKARRGTEAADWESINRTLEAAGRAKRGDPGWQLAPRNPSDFHANLVAALEGEPDLGGLTEVTTVEDLALHLDRADVARVIKERLFMDPRRQFAPMMALKRSIAEDWAVVNYHLEQAGRRSRPDQPGWILPVRDPAAFEANLAAAVGPVDFAAAGPEAAGVADLDAYLARIAEAEAWFFLPAEDVARVIAAHDSDEATPAGAQAWRTAEALLATAYGRKVRAAGAAALRAIREGVPAGQDGLAAELEAALGELPPSPDDWMEALARYAPAEDVAVVRAALAPRRRGRRAAKPDWDRIDAILEEARRRRLRLPEPTPRKEHWRALYAYPDARAAKIGADGLAWRCFGGVPAAAGPDDPPAAIGWAIASPALALSTGLRRLVLTLGFRDDRGGPLIAPPDDHTDTPRKAPFSVSLSGTKRWIEPTSVAFAEVDYRAVPGVAPVDTEVRLVALQVSMTLDETAPEITASPDAAAFGGTPWPVLRLMLRPVWDADQRRFDTAYERFRTLNLLRAHLAAGVGKYAAAGAPGLWPLAVETEVGPADGKKPFEPFGATPSIGSELALGHRDLLHKRLTDVSLGLDWLGGPANLGTHYQFYEARSFVAQLSLVDGGVRTTALATPAALFAGTDTGAHVRIERQIGDAIRIDPVVEPLAAEVRSWRRYLTLRLAGTDFGHRAYPSLATAKSIELANALRQGTSVTPASFTVNPPYTPKLKRIALDFAAAHEIDVTRYHRATAVDRLFHVHPFGVEEAAGTGWPLLPAYAEEGAFYIGLDEVDPPQGVALLFAAVEAGGAEERAGALRWSYLDAGGWTDFSEPPEDETDGLTRRGIVRFSLPPAAPDSRMPGGLYWLRATMADGAANACDLIDVHAQAASARFIDNGAPPEHYLAPLPAGSVRTIGDLAPGLARVQQPYPTSEGRAPEGDAAFRTRASERLRHKGRALTVWDYEHLVLERFPGVHKVKCIPASLADGGPGSVRLVVIPDIRGQFRPDPFTPRAPARLLDEIASSLAALAPATARIAVGHARFLRVRVRVGVRFRAAGEEEYDKRRLAEQLNRHLAPWAFDEGADIAIGQRIEATSIVALIDRLPYVDFVGACRLFVSGDDGETYRLGADDGASVEAATEDGVLTPASRHEIDVISDDLFEPSRFTGVGYMKVELDFVVG